MMKKLLSGLILLTSMHVTAQPVDTNAVLTIDGIVKEVLSIISGEAEKERDWISFKNLFLPTAQFSVLYHIDNGTKKINTFSLEQFVETVGNSYKTHGFLEYEINKTVDEYNGIAHVFQVYYAKESDIEERGMNSIQLVHDGNRWWIVSILWTNDRNGVEIPKKYLGE